MLTRRVLVVDDDHCQRRLFHRLLSSRGFEPILSATGTDALIQASAARPLLALIDISMPGMDGITLLKRLRADAATAAMPVILMTGLPIPESFMEAAAESLKAGPIYTKCRTFDNLERRIEHELRPRFLRRGRLLVAMEPRRVTVEGHAVHVAGHRLDLLCVLLGTAGPVSRRTLLWAVWPAKDNPNIVDVNILRLRRDLASCPGVAIESSAAGYRLVVREAQAQPTSAA